MDREYIKGKKQIIAAHARPADNKEGDYYGVSCATTIIACCVTHFYVLFIIRRRSRTMLLGAIHPNPSIRILCLLELLIIERKNEQQCPNYEVRDDLLNGCEFRRIKDDELSERDAH
jgi:hypothetical protein